MESSMPQNFMRQEDSIEKKQNETTQANKKQKSKTPTSNLSEN